MDRILEVVGTHVSASPQKLIQYLRKKIYADTGHAEEAALLPTPVFPILERDLYSAEPWNLFNDDDPWEANQGTARCKFVRKTIYVYTKLKPWGKNFVRTTPGGGTWDGSTSTGNSMIRKDGNKTAPIIGFKKFFDFKLKGVKRVSTSNQSLGHWMMHEFKLGGTSLEGLDDKATTLAKNFALCLITQKLDKQFWRPVGKVHQLFLRYKAMGYFDRLTPANPQLVRKTNRRDDLTKRKQSSRDLKCSNKRAGKMVHDGSVPAILTNNRPTNEEKGSADHDTQTLTDKVEAIQLHGETEGSLEDKQSNSK